MTFNLKRLFNNMTPTSETKTRAVLRNYISARAALAELCVSGDIIPNQTILINSMPLLEVQASSEIENTVITAG